jgi:hypothetical protein
MGNFLSTALTQSAMRRTVMPRNWLKYLRGMDNMAGLLLGGTATAGAIYLYIFYVARRVRIANNLPRLTAQALIFGNRAVIPFSFMYTVINL